jgi:altronate hydrolase
MKLSAKEPMLDIRRYGKIIIFHPHDNVVIAAERIEKGEKLVVGDLEVVIKESIPQWHKVAIKPIKKGDYVIKLGCKIGKASRRINIGEWVSTHNLSSHWFRGRAVWRVRAG